MTEGQKRTRQLRHLLADLGFSEAITYPFGPERWVRDLRPNGTGDAVEIKNPLSAEGRFLRSEILPGLLDAAARNRTFGARGGALFEVGRVFDPAPPPGGLREAALRFRFTGKLDALGPDAEPNAASLMGVREEERVGVVLAGVVRAAGWNTPEVRADLFGTKGMVERLVPGATFGTSSPAFLHPGRSAVVCVEDREVGWVGELHPDVAERFGLDGWPVAAFELDVAACEPDPTPRFEPFVNVPAVARDLAVVVEEGAPVGEMLRAIENLRSPTLVEARVFDVYSGSQVPRGQKSVALAFTFQGERTLTDREVDGEVERFAALLRERFGAEVRT